MGISNMWSDFKIPSTLAEDEVYQTKLRFEDEVEEMNNQLIEEENKRKNEAKKRRIHSKKPNTIPQPFKFDSRPIQKRYSKASQELDGIRIQKQIQEDNHLKIKI